MLSRGWLEPWLRSSWQGAKEPELAVLKYEMIFSFQSIWLILGKYDHLWFWVTGIWAPTFLVKVVTHKLYFSGVTAFSSLSADLRSRLKPPSDHGSREWKTPRGWSLTLKKNLVAHLSCVHGKYLCGDGINCSFFPQNWTFGSFSPRPGDLWWCRYSNSIESPIQCPFAGFLVKSIAAILKHITSDQNNLLSKYFFLSSLPFLTSKAV